MTVAEELLICRGKCVCTDALSDLRKSHSSLLCSQVVRCFSSL